MTTAVTSPLSGFLEAILARDFPRARDFLHPEIDFRAMTPKRIWEAESPVAVEETIRAWFEHPDRQVERVEPVEPVTVEDILRVGWRVYGQSVDGPFVFEQQAYVREHEGRIAWLRIMCSGPRPASTPPQPSGSNV